MPAGDLCLPAPPGALVPGRLQRRGRGAAPAAALSRQLRLTVDAPITPLALGDEAALTIVVANNGAETVENVRLYLPQERGVEWLEPAGVTWLEMGALAVGESRTVAARVRVAAMPRSGYLRFFVGATGDEAKPQHERVDLLVARADAETATAPAASYDFTYEGDAHWYDAWSSSTEFWWLTSITPHGLGGAALPAQTYGYVDPSGQTTGRLCHDHVCVLLLSTVANGYGAVTKVGNRVLTVLPGDNPTQLYTPFPDYEKEVPGGANPTVTQRVTFSANGRAMAQWVKVGTTATLYALYTDHLGSVVAVGTAGGGLVANSYATYQPFGAFVSNPTGTNPSVTDRGFTGHKHNNTGTNNLGLIYMNARYYHPQLGRFVSPDTVVPEPGEPQSYNRYSYVNCTTNLLSQHTIALRCKERTTC